MSDPIKVKHGNYVKGLMHLQRRDAAAAKAAFIEADDFPNARRQLPFIIKDLGGSPSEILGALSAALDDGDMQALPWLIRFNDQFRYSHPDIKLFKKNLESAVEEENQSVLLGLMRIAREDRDVKEYLGLMIQFPVLKDEKECGDFIEAAEFLMKAAPLVANGQRIAVTGDGRKVTFTVTVE